MALGLKNYWGLMNVSKRENLIKTLLCTDTLKYP